MEPKKDLRDGREWGKGRWFSSRVISSWLVGPSHESPKQMEDHASSRFLTLRFTKKFDIVIYEPSLWEQ